jgi:prepilin-type N-terminal cleavage/methylation domain-containing protein
MNKYRINAFTLMEVTVAMLISAVVIGITYTSYSIIVKYYASYNKKNTAVGELATVDHLLRRDFDKADSIQTDTAGVVFYENEQKVKYEFNPNFIVRKAAGIDTFKVDTKTLSLLFEGVPVNDELSTGRKTIDELSFTLLYEKAEIPYHYHKLYSSENLLNSVTNAIN